MYVYVCMRVRVCIYARVHISKQVYILYLEIIMCISISNLAFCIQRLS